jgi:hypothetical protein
MKRANNLLKKVADPDNLRLAFWKAKKGKSYSRNVLTYQHQLESNLSRLREQILSNRVDVGQYSFFKVYDPKERQICAPSFQEQVLHHALMNVCHPFFERFQIFDSYASRKRKGTYAAIARAKKFSNKYPWYLKLDVRQFFASIHQEVLKEQLRRLFKEQNLLDIFGKIIDSFESEPQRGLPIGNLTSQYFANHYMAGLDHFIREELLVSAYVRYMDDMVVWANDKKELIQTFKSIRLFVEEKLLCSLKPHGLNRTSKGLSFLGYHIFPTEVRLTQRSKRRFISKFRELDDKYNNGEWSEALCQRRILPLLAFTLHAQTRGLRKKVIYCT